MAEINQAESLEDEEWEGERAVEPARFPQYGADCSI
jgi:hypothetical protein